MFSFLEAGENLLHIINLTLEVLVVVNSVDVHWVSTGIFRERHLAKMWGTLDFIVLVEFPIIKLLY